MLIEEMREGAVMLSEDNTILYANRGFANIVKCSLEKLVGINVEVFVSSTFKVTFNGLLDECRGLGKPNSFTKGIAFIACDHSLVPTQVSVNSITINDASTTVVVVTDLSEHMDEEVKRYTTELELAQIALSESEQRWATTLASIGDAVIATDMLGKIKFMNGVAEKLTGWILVEAAGRPVNEIFNIINEFTRKTVDDPVTKVLEKGTIVGLANHTILVRKDKTETAIDDSGAPIKSKDGKTTGVVLIFRDITERKKAEEALQYNEFLLGGFFDSPGNMRGIVELINGKDIRHIKDNMVTASYVGLTPADLKGKLSSELGEPVERIKTWIEHYKQTQETGQPVTWEYTDKEGSKVTWLSPTVTYIGKSSEGNPRFTYVVTDITKRKQAEEALKQSEQTFHELIERAPFGIYVVNSHFRIQHMNKGSQDGAFRNVRPVIGRDFSEAMHILWPEPTASEILSHFRHTLETGEPYYSPKFIHPRYDVEIVEAYEWELLRIKFPDGQYGVICYYFDSTKLRETERGLSEAQAKLKEYATDLERLVEERTKKLEIASSYARKLIEASLDSLVTISSEGKITDVNKATEIVTGCSREQMIGSDFSDYFTEPGKADAGYKLAFKEGLVRDYPLSIKSKTGKITNVLYNATVYTNEAGEILGVFAAARDITELRKAEAGAQEAAKKLKDSERLAAIGATAGMVGHDIRNPLQAITGDLYLAKTDLASIPESEEKQAIQESLGAIESNIDYINKIVQDLQDYARPLKPKPEEADLKVIITKLFEKNNMPDNIELSVKVENSAEKICTDSYYINRIMFNLINNAVQAMPNGGKLTVHAYRSSKDLVLTVEDTGVGIPKEIQGKMFTAMFTTKSKGQGFGLPVVKRMTESLGGTVTFESQEGKGTTFTVRLPLKG